MKFKRLQISPFMDLNFNFSQLGLPTCVSLVGLVLCWSPWQPSVYVSCHSELQVFFAIPDMLESAVITESNIFRVFSIKEIQSTIDTYKCYDIIKEPYLMNLQYRKERQNVTL